MNRLSPYLDKLGVDTDYVSRMGGFFVTYDKRPALSMPTMAEYQNRIIFLDGKVDKYKWAEKDAPHPPLFWCVPDGSKIAVITNGEKASLVLAQQGIACANVFGEGNELDRAIPLIKAAGVSHLIIVPDCDKAGIRAAQKWLEQGSKAGLDVVILDLGAYLKRVYTMEYHEFAKWDLRDLWLLLEQDSDIFKEVLYSLPHLNFEDYQDWLPQAQISEVFRPNYKPSPDQPDLLNLYQEWWNNEVLPHVAIAAPNGRIHKHQKCRNPLHDDHNPSFRITEQGHPVCTCGKVSYDDVAAWFGAISWQDYRKQHDPEKKHVDREVKKAVERRGRYDDLICLPDALRKAIVKDKQANLGRIVDILLYEKTPVNQPITRQEIVEKASRYDMSQASVYRVFDTFSHFLHRIGLGEEILQIQNEKKSNHRPAIHYTLALILHCLERVYRYSIRTTGDLLYDHEAALCNAREYRKYTVLKIIPDKVEIKVSLKKIGRDIRLSAGTIGKYIRELAVQGLVAITQNFKRKEITPDDIPHLSDTLDDWKRKFSNAFVEMYQVVDGIRRAFNHLGGKSGVPNNRIPPSYEAVMQFLDPPSNKARKYAKSNLIFIMVTKQCNSYKRLQVAC